MIYWLLAAFMLVVAVWFIMRQKAKARRVAPLLTRTPGPEPEPEQVYEIRPAFPVKATLHLWYTDRDGQQTERSIDVREVGVGVINNTLVSYCHLRNGIRHFYLHRITQCADMETGELITDVYQYLRQKYEQSPEYKVDDLLNNKYDALQILFYIGKADGALRKAEREIIRETCRSLADDSSITDDMIDRLFRDIQLMTEPAFKLAVGRLAKRTADIKKTVLDAAEKMIASDKKIHPTEQAALDYMKKRWVI